MQEILSSKISLAQLELLKVSVPQRESFRSAIGVRNERLALFVIWRDADGNFGIGECSCRPDPFFNGEFVDGAIDVIQTHLFHLFQKEMTLADLSAILQRARGWHFTCAAILDAVFDLLRRRKEPDLLDAWSETRVAAIPVGISLGIFTTQEGALQRVQKAANEGYRRIKLKVSPAMDVNTVIAVRNEFKNLYIGFDANGSFSENDFLLLRQLAEIQPAMIEQPFSPRRLDLCLKLRRELPSLKICLDEGISCLGDLKTAHMLNAMQEVNLKPGRVGGQLETVQILHHCLKNDIACWVGGMFETGIGRLANLRVAACLPDARAHDLSPSSRYFKRDVVKRPLEMTQDGLISLSDDRPVSLDESAIEAFVVERKTLTLN